MIIAPAHMDRWSRMERLYRHLLGMGLCVSPIFADAERGQIDHLHVSVDLPQQSGDTASAKRTTATTAQGSGETGNSTACALVPPPMSGPQVGDVLGTAKGIGDNVVLLPTVLRGGVPVIAPPDGVALEISSPFSGVEAGNNISLLPDS
jgi:hypothetical protein